MDCSIKFYSNMREFAFSPVGDNDNLISRKLIIMLFTSELNRKSVLISATWVKLGLLFVLFWTKGLLSDLIDLSNCRCSFPFDNQWKFSSIKLGCTGSKTLQAPSAAEGNNQTRDVSVNDNEGSAMTAPKISFPAENSPQRANSSGSLNIRAKVVPLKPGRSLMDWIRLGKSARDLAGNGGIVRPITEEELSQHNTQSDAWICIRGMIVLFFSIRWFSIPHFLPDFCFEKFLSTVSALFTFKFNKTSSSSLFTHTHKNINIVLSANSIAYQGGA